jgi:N-acyl-D-aspartate/D-glutamate deacylase
MSEFDLVIKGGTIVDGLRVPRYRADVGIVGSRVAYIGRISASDAEQVLDAGGLIVAPGFVDLHTHYDSQIFWDPWCTISGYHGVTSLVIGNCGFGFAPCKPKDRDRAMLTLSRNEAVPLKTMQAGMLWDWETFPEFLESLARIPKGVNVMPYIGLSPVYAYVMGGFDAAKERRPTEDELKKMCEILIEAIEAGACGFSAQMFGDSSNVQRDFDGTPMVTDTITMDELGWFARAMGSTGRGVFQAAGGSAAMGRVDLIEASELVARESGRPVLFNVLTAAPGAEDQHGMPVPGMEETMAQLDRLNSEGMRVYGQAITNPDTESFFTMADYNFFDNSVVWREATLGEPPERLAKFSDPQCRAALKAEYDAELAGTSLMVGAGRIPSIRVHWVPDTAPPELKHFEGRTIAEVAEQEHKHVIDAFLDLACVANLRTEFQLKSTPRSTEDPERMRKLVRYKYSLPGVSDGGAHTKYVTLGSYTTHFLTEWVREHEMLDLEEAHWRLAAYPAQVAGIRDRGFIREGAPADIVVYDFENLQSLPPKRTYDFPAGEWRLVRKASGYRYTIVNGQVTFVDGEHTGHLPGQLLRHGAVENRS